MVALSYRELIPAENFKPQTISATLPPQNIDVEESILGGLLLDPKAYDLVKQILVKDAFYIQAHQQIYEAIATLKISGQPADLMTVSTWLNDRGILEKVGGTAKLANLVSRTVSTVNVDRYAELVMEKYARRVGIEIGEAVADSFRDTATDINTLKKRAEKLFGYFQTDSIEQRAEQLFNKYLAEEHPLKQYYIRQEVHTKLSIGKAAFPKLLSYYEDLKTAPVYRSYTAREAAAAPRLNATYIIDRYLPRGEMILLAGPPKVGKSQLASQLALSCVTGTEFLGEKVHGKQNLLYYTCDENYHSTQDRAKELGLEDLEEASNWHYREHLNLLLKSQLENEIKELKPDVIIIDCLFAIADKIGVNVCDPEFSMYVGRFQKLAQEYNCSIVLLHHNNKNKQQEGIDRVFGSQALTRIPWGIYQLVFKKTTDAFSAERILNCTARGEEGSSHELILNHKDEWMLDGIYTYVKERSYSLDIEGNYQQQILEFLKNHPVATTTAKLIMEVLNAGRVIYKELDKLCRIGLIQRVRNTADRRQWIYILQNDDMTKRTNGKNNYSFIHPGGGRGDGLNLQDPPPPPKVNNVEGDYVEQKNAQNHYEDKISNDSTIDKQNSLFTNTSLQHVNNDGNFNSDSTENKYYIEEEEKKRSTAEQSIDAEIEQHTDKNIAKQPKQLKPSKSKGFGFQIKDRVRISDKDSKFAEKEGIIEKHKNGQYLIKLDSLSGETAIRTPVHSWAIEKI